MTTDRQSTAQPQPDQPGQDDHQPDPSATRRFQCRHIRANGLRCQAVSLRGESLCYYHHTNRRRTRPAAGPAEPLTLPLIEDRPSIQLALNEIIARIAARTIDRKDAGLILYALQIASSNLARDTPPRTQPSSQYDDRCQEDNHRHDIIEHITLDPELGPLAPILSMDAEDEAHKSLIQKFNEYCERPKEPCAQCAEYQERERNRAEAGRLLAELSRRRALGLPDYDPPLNFYEPYPADQAWAAAQPPGAAIQHAQMATKARRRRNLTAGEKP